MANTHELFTRLKIAARDHAAREDAELTRWLDREITHAEYVARMDAEDANLKQAARLFALSELMDDAVEKHNVERGLTD